MEISVSARQAFHFNLPLSQLCSIGSENPACEERDFLIQSSTADSNGRVKWIAELALTLITIRQPACLGCLQAGCINLYQPPEAFVTVEG